MPHKFHGHHSAGDIVEFLQVIECTENNNLHHFALRIKIVAIFCNSMPFGAAWAYYNKVLVLASAAS